jgi:hypothetical protein
MTPTPEQLNAVRTELLAWILDQYGTKTAQGKQLMVDITNPPPQGHLCAEIFATTLVLKDWVQDAERAPADEEC